MAATQDWHRRLRDAREAQGVSQTDLAARIGTCQSAISELEAGSDARLSTYDRWAGALGYELQLVPAVRRSLVEVLADRIAGGAA